jgi:hypothetical protein
VNRSTLLFFTSFFLLVSFSSYAQTSVKGYTLADLAETSEAAAGPGQLTVGYCVISPDRGQSTPSAFEIIRYRANGVLISETGVPAGPALLSGRSYAQFDGPVNTGIAIVNPSSSPVTISFYFTDASTGNDFAQGNVTLGPRFQVAAFVNQAPFNVTSNFTGTFTFIAPEPVALLTLRALTNDLGEFLMSAQSVVPLNQLTSGRVVIPQFADGAGWNTSVELFNTGDQSMIGTVQFFNEGANNESATPISMIVNGNSGTSFPYTIAPRSSVHLDTAGIGPLIQVGSVVVTPTGNSNTNPRVRGSNPLGRIGKKKEVLPSRWHFFFLACRVPRMGHRMKWNRVTLAGSLAGSSFTSSPRKIPSFFAW